MSHRPAYGTAEGRAFAVQIDSLSANDYFKLPFGRQLDDLKKIAAFKQQAKTAWIGCKGKPTLPAVRRWVAEHKPQQFFTSWGADSRWWKDDSVQIHYTESSSAASTGVSHDQS